MLSYVTLASPGFRPDEVLLHLAYFAYTFIDFWINGLQVRLLHFYIVPPFVVIYNALTAILYYTLFSHNYNHRSMYTVNELRLNRIAICIFYYFAFVIVVPLAIHIVFYMLCLLRSHVIELPFWTRPLFRRQYEGEILEEPIHSPARDEETGGGVGGGARHATVGTFSFGRKSNRIMPIVEAEENDHGDEEGEIILANTIIESLPGVREMANRSAWTTRSQPYN